MKKFLCLLVLIILIVSLVSCDMVANHITIGYLSTIDGTVCIEHFQNVYKLDIENKTYSQVSYDFFAETAFDDENELKYDYFAGEYGGQIPLGYEGVAEHIENCELDSETSMVEACGYVGDGVLNGLVQVYKDGSGVYGNYAMEKIDHSLIFTYDADTDDFSVIKIFEDVVVLAFSEQTVIYWKNKAYYAYDLNTSYETYLIDDKAYDGGLQQQSSPSVFFDEKICVFHLVKAKFHRDVEYMYVFDFESNEFFELTPNRD